MFAIVVDLLCERYTATRFNDRSEPEWPPHPARLFSAMTAAWAYADKPDHAEHEALEWLERQQPPAITCGAEGRRAVVTHFVPVNDPTTLTRDVSRNFGLIEQARKLVSDAEREGDERAFQRAQAALTKAEAKAIADGQRAGRPTGTESVTVAAAVLQVLPDNRGKQGRTYPTVIPDDATVWFSWPDAAPTEAHLDALDRLLARVGRVGHSSTFVSCRVTASVPSPTWVPGSDGDQRRLRVPREGLLNHLEAAFEVHQGSEPRTLPAAMADYRRPIRQRPVLPVPLLGGDWFVLGFQGRPLPATRVLDIARATRNALLEHSDQVIPFLSGHQPSVAGDRESTPPLDRPHLAVVPLPSAGHQYSDGSVLGVALVLPSDCSDAERLALHEAVRTWASAGFKLCLPSRSGTSICRVVNDLGVDRAASNRPRWLDSDMPARRRTMTRGYWCRPSRRWLTVTPVALDRFPGQLRAASQRARERAEAEAEASIARACALAGLPADPAVLLRLDAPLTGLPAAPVGRGGLRGGWYRQFPGYATGNGTPRICVHAEIEFGEPVRGPVLIGAGRYFGYGLCLPADPRSEDAR